jgi:hypothetical protein
MDATHVYCARCRSIQRAAYDDLIGGIEPLGTKAACASCGWVVLTMMKGARLFCDVCDDIRPALLHEYRPAGVLQGGLVRCAVCYASRARLYGSKVTATK